ncbi:MAG: ATP-binding protein [Candidatus Omnitrophica bacterium]|nr:ATP-binding protein [Candidatus Omnitrophota bacterium]
MSVAVAVRKRIKKKPESEKYEFKGSFFGTDAEWLKLIKTIVAIANTSGGSLEVKTTNDVDLRLFDAARIDDKVNAYISPRIQNLTTRTKNSAVIIAIPNSPSKPHIFIKRGMYQNPKPPPQQLPEFHEGQIWVRHSGKNELLTKDDFDRILKEKLNEFLASINIMASQFPISAKELKVVESTVDPNAVPIQVKESGEGLPVLLKKERVDPNLDYPYNAKEMGKLLGKSQNFIAYTVKKLGLKGDMKYAVQLKNPQGKVVMVKYSNEALVFLKKFLADNPTFNPYKQI